MRMLPILSIPKIRIPSDSVPLLCLHFLVDEVERVNVAREVAEEGQADVARGQKALARATNDEREKGVHEKVTCAAADHEDGGWREEDRDLSTEGHLVSAAKGWMKAGRDTYNDEQDITTSNHDCTLMGSNYCFGRRKR